MTAGFDTILAGIEEAGEQQIAAILDSANIEAKRIRTSAEADAHIVRDRILAAGHARLNRECALIEQRAMMQKMQVHADARQKLIDKIIDLAQSNIAKVRKDKNYPVILESLAVAAINAIIPSLSVGQKIFLHLDKQDQPIVMKFKLEEQAKIEFVFDIECSGGCIAESEDCQVRVLNTIESRFDRAKNAIQQELSIFLEKKVHAV